MVKHKIQDRSSPVLYLESVQIKQSVVDRVRMLLEIKDFDDLSDKVKEKLNIEEDHEELIYSVTFADGATLDWRLCSGASNYYDDVLFHYETGHWETLDCTFEFDDIEIDAGSKIYNVKLEIIKDE